MTSIQNHQFYVHFYFLILMLYLFILLTIQSIHLVFINDFHLLFNDVIIVLYSLIHYLIIIYIYLMNYDLSQFTVYDL